MEFALLDTARKSVYHGLNMIVIFRMMFTLYRQIKAFSIKPLPIVLNQIDIVNGVAQSFKLDLKTRLLFRKQKVKKKIRTGVA